MSNNHYAILKLQGIFFETSQKNYLNYYIDNFNGRYINDDFVYTYLGYDFKVVFNESNFIISFYS